MSATSKPVRLIDVARKANVSEAAASYALRGKPGVSIETAQRVTKAAEELGYKRNPLISTLMEEVRRSGSIFYKGNLAFLNFYDDSERLINDPYFVGELFRGIQDQSKHYGYSVDPFPIGELVDNPKRLLQILNARGYDGVYIGPLKSESHNISIDWGNRAAIAVGYTYALPSVARVAPDNFSALLEAAEIIYKHGYRRLGIVFHRDDIDARSHYGFTSALSTFCRLKGLSFISPYVYDGGEEGLLNSWIKEHDPDFVFTTCLTLSPSIEKRFATKLCYIGDKTPEGCMGLSQRPKELGRMAADELCAMIARNERGIPDYPRTVGIPVRLDGFNILKPAK